MNYEMLDKAIPARRLPDDGSLPRATLFKMFRDLEELRAELNTVPNDAETFAAIEKQIKTYERILET